VRIVRPIMTASSKKITPNATSAAEVVQAISASATDTPRKLLSFMCWLQVYARTQGLEIHVRCSTIARVFQVCRLRLHRRLISAGFGARLTDASRHLHRQMPSWSARVYADTLKRQGKPGRSNCNYPRAGQEAGRMWFVWSMGALVLFCTVISGMEDPPFKR
jgi:hypothetical protein